MHEGVEVADLEIAGGVGATQPELSRGKQGPRDGRGPAYAELWPRASGRGEPRAVPELDRERPFRHQPAELAVQRCGAGERHLCGKSPIPRLPGGAVWQNHRPVDRRLANRNLRTALIAGAISVIVFAVSFLVAFVY